MNARLNRLQSIGVILSVMAAIALSSCASDPGSAQAMQDHQEQRKQVQREQDFAKALPPTPGKPIYGE